MSEVFQIWETVKDIWGLFGRMLGCERTVSVVRRATYMPEVVWTVFDTGEKTGYPLASHGVER